MNTPVATNPSKAIPLVVSSVEEIPLNRIRDSTTNPRCQFDETNLAVLAGFVPGNKIRVMFRTRLCGHF